MNKFHYLKKNLGHRDIRILQTKTRIYVQIFIIDEV